MNHSGGQVNDLSAVTRQRDAFKKTAFWWNNYHSSSMIGISAHPGMHI